MRIALGTLGCKLNQAESERLTREILQHGHMVVDTDAAADVYILNTCTVTGTADAKCRAWLRQARRHNPEARLVITGCYAQRVPDDLARMEGVAVVAGNGEKDDLLSRLGALGVVPSSEPVKTTIAAGRTRSFIKIQDGCDRACSYCIVPIVRGHEKSRGDDEIVREVESRVQEGCREVVFTGTEVGAYHGGVGLHGLLQRILAETDISRVRLSSLQPQEVTSKLLELWRDERLCQHFHICLQSGSKAVLRRMKRGYSIDDFQRVLGSIRAAMPDASITTDVIVGFPGETDGEFQESLEFCREAAFARIHVFPYSMRAGTEAALMDKKVTHGIVKERGRAMLVLARDSADAFRRKFIGRKLPVLWEASKTEGLCAGLTGNYIKVYGRSDIDLKNKIVAVPLSRVKGDGIWTGRVDFT